MSLPSWTEVIEQAMATAAYYVFVSLPATVTAVDNEGGTVDLRPGVRRRKPNREIEEYPSPIPSVPVFQLAGSGFSVQLPVAVGDTGLLLMANESLGIWLREGELADPPIGGRLNPALFLPALQPETTRQPIPSSGAVIDAATIDLGTGGAGVARISDEVEITIPPGVSLVTPSTGVTLGPFTFSGTITSASTTVKAKG